MYEWWHLLAALLTRRRTFCSSPRMSETSDIYFAYPSLNVIILPINEKCRNFYISTFCVVTVAYKNKIRKLDTHVWPFPVKGCLHVISEQRRSLPYCAYKQPEQNTSIYSTVFSESVPRLLRPWSDRVDGQTDLGFNSPHMHNFDEVFSAHFWRSFFFFFFFFKSVH